MNISFDRKGPKSVNGLLAMILGTTTQNVYKIKNGTRGKRSKIAANLKYAEWFLENEMKPKLRNLEKTRVGNRELMEEIVNEVRTELFENARAYRK